MPTKRFLIKGKVQGVFYRATAKEVAEKLGLSGWIRNTDEGEVEAMATGTGEQLQAFANWCRKGPPRSRVTGIDETDAAEEAFTGFKIIR